MDEQVCVREQLVQRRAAIGLCGVHNDAALVGVDGGEQAPRQRRAVIGAAAGDGSGLDAFTVGSERPTTARGVASRRLHLDDVGAQVGEQLGRPRRRHHLSHLDDTDAVETARGHRSVRLAAVRPWTALDRSTSLRLHTGTFGRGPVGLKAIRA